LTANATGVFLAALETVFNLFVRNKETYREKEERQRRNHKAHTHTRKGKKKKKSNRAGFDPLFSLFFQIAKIKREKKKKK